LGKLVVDTQRVSAFHAKGGNPLNRKVEKGMIIETRVNQLHQRMMIN
jgi:hypothetical protein